MEVSHGERDGKRGVMQSADGSTQRLIVVAAVFWRADQVLACRRAEGRSAAGRWEFPGGKIEPGESPEQALRREIAEELGVVITVGPLLDRSTTIVDGVAVDLSCYHVVKHHPEPVHSTDHDQLRWQPRHRLAELVWADPDLPAVRQLITLPGPADC